MNAPTENQRIARAAGIVGGATLLSRVFGFVRDAAIAWLLGAGLYSDAFIAAFRIPNLFRRLFAEGSIGAAFVPVFTEYLVRSRRQAALQLAASAFRLMSVLLLAATAVGLLLAPWLVAGLAPGFDGFQLELTVRLTRVMVPYLFFITLVALSMGVLNSLGHFAAPALAPVCLNLTVIAAIFLAAPHFSQPVMALAVGVCVGGFFQLLLQIPFLVRREIRFWKGTALWHPGMGRIARLLPPVVLTGAAYQINLLVVTVLGSFLPEGSITYLYYADRMVQFPLGIFAIAASTAILPSLSRQAAAGDVDALQKTLSDALCMIFFITIPAAVGLIVLAEPILALLFQRGEFDLAATRLTAYALSYYAVGLPAFSAVRIVSAVFYALQNTRTPALITFAVIACNILLGIVFMRFMAHGGLALAVALASILNLGLLAAALHIRHLRADWRRIARSIVKTTSSAMVMGVTVWILKSILRDGFYLPLQVGGLILTGIAVYALTARLVGSSELVSVIRQIENGVKQKWTKSKAF
jgi:putative peptidoglycan lipid II flippase